MANKSLFIKKVLSSKGMSIVLAVVYVLFILTFSIGLPLYFRPFYYAHIKPLGLEAASNRTYDEIVYAYNELLDYCVFGKEFAMGNFRYSEEGYSHFADCKILFDLSGIVLLITAIILIGVLVYKILTKENIATLKGYSPSFWGSVVLLSVIAIAAVWGALDFDSLFTAFHTVFFPGKTNWYFDPRTDEIIKVLPWEFFRNCAILIAISVLAFSISFIVVGIKKKERIIKDQ